MHRRIFTAPALAALCVALGSSPLAAHQTPADARAEAPVMSLDQILAAFGWDFDTTEIETEKVAEGLHVLFGLGGNIAVSSGEDGVLIVDDQFPQLTPKIKKALRKIGDSDVDIVVNTHWHFDHAEGNLELGKNKRTQIVAQKNSREMMQSDNIINLVAVQYNQEAYPEHALPDITYDKSMSFYFNGEEVSLLHFGVAHTTGDTAVIFRKRNAVHMGDVYNNSGYPFIDVGNGGRVGGMIAFCESVLAEIDDNTIVIPGHGPVATKADMTRYVEILSTTRDRIKTMVDEGKSLEDVVAAAPTADFDEELGANAAAAARYIDRVYTDLASE